MAGGFDERSSATRFTPGTSLLMRLLVRAARKGVDVRLLLPGPKADVPLARHAAHGTYSALLASGVRLFEYQSATLHSKTVVVDSYVSVVGSSNLDFRSFWLNAECNLLMFDDHCATALEEAFLTDLKESEEITPVVWSARTVSHRLFDVAARGMRWAL